ncbi:MAG: hypothetical protein KatS3mg011_1098 [Acidimicrobiia bacterium]|nr:MAG: hypothetical protein KatS3mg011_1098 [Acidimicrobiia bacterium]
MAVGRLSRPNSAWVPPLVVAVASIAILTVLNPWHLISPTTPSGGDMGAHVYPPDYLQNVLLPSGRLQGWSQDWFAGFPIYYFYFPLPSLVIVLADLVLPYGVAFKLVTVSGLVALPPAVYFLVRCLRFSRTVAAVCAAGVVPFTLMESYSIYGANVASTLAGEFAFSWSFALGFVYLGLLVRTVRGEPHLGPWAALVFALTALSHVLTVIVLVVASLFVVRRKGSSRLAIPIWVWAAAMTGVWSIPFLLRIGYSTDMAWTPLSRVEELFPVEIWLLLPIAIAGGVWAVRRTYDAVPLVVATLVPVFYYPIPVLASSLAPQIFGEGRFKLWNGRLLPYWYFGVTLFASLALGGFVVWLTRRLPRRVGVVWVRAAVVAWGVAGLAFVASRPEAPGWASLLVAVMALLVLGATLALGTVSARALLTGLASTVLVFGGLAGLTFVDGWARWNYTGYEGKEAWDEYRAFMETIDRLPPGRVQWEFNRELDKYGTTMSLMLIPYWTGPEHPSMEGLFFESSITVPFHFLNQAETSLSPSSPVPGLRYRTFDFDRGIQHLRLYGVRYYVAYTEEAKSRADAHPDLIRIAETGPFVVYEIADVAMVEPLAYPVAVYVGSEDFEDLALEWYDDLSLLDRPVAADGPPDWPRVTDLDQLPDRTVWSDGQVEDVLIEDHRISFRTSAVGVPHLVKVSYFPNWKAYGADGPYRVTPSLMVVVPTAEEVELRFERTWVEWTGLLASVAGFGLFFLFVFRRRRDGSTTGS